MTQSDEFDVASATALKAAFEDTVMAWPEVASKLMFGRPSYTAAGELFALLEGDGVVLTKLPDEERAKLTATAKTRPFMAGDRMVKKWVHVTIEDLDELASIEPALEASYERAITAADS